MHVVFCGNFLVTTMKTCYTLLYKFLYVCCLSDIMIALSSTVLICKGRHKDIFTSIIHWLTLYKSILLSNYIFGAISCVIHILDWHRSLVVCFCLFLLLLVWFVFCFKKFLISTNWFVLLEISPLHTHPVLRAGWFSLAVANLPEDH